MNAAGLDGRNRYLLSSIPFSGEAIWELMNVSGVE
jgi:hypothetical protein